MLAHRLQRWPNIGPMPRVCWSNIKRGPDMDSIRGPPLDSQVGGGGGGAGVFLK